MDIWQEHGAKLRNPKDISHLFFSDQFLRPNTDVCLPVRSEGVRAGRSLFSNIPNEEHSRSPSHFRHRISNHLRDSVNESETIFPPERNDPPDPERIQTIEVYNFTPSPRSGSIETLQLDYATE